MRLNAPKPQVVGRSRERRQLARHFAAARAGQAQAVLVRGPAGIGKTRLLDSIAYPDVPLVRATCREATARTQFGVAQQLLAALGTSLHDAVNTDAAPSDGQPSGPLGTGYDPHARAHLAGTPDRDELLALGQVAADLLDRAPLILVVDDAQWCDEGSARWLDFLLSHGARRPLFVVLGQASERRTAVCSVFDAIVAEGRCDPLELGPLPEQAVAGIVADVFQEQGAPSFNRRCAEFSGGNPLLLMRLLDALRVSGVRPDEHGTEQMPKLGQQLPGHGVLTDLLQWPPHMCQVARAVALLVSVDPDLIGTLAQLPHRLVTSALQELRDRGVLGGYTPTFAAETFRDALLAEIPESAMVRLRIRAARILDDAAHPVTEIAEQLLHLPRLDESWMLDVLRDAAAEADDCTAARYLSRLWQEDPSQPSVRLELARSLLVSDPVLALSHLEHALAQATDVRTRARTAAQFGWASMMLDNNEDVWRTVSEATDALEDVLGEHPSTEDRELHALLLSTLGAVGMAHTGLLRRAWERVDPARSSTAMANRAGVAPRAVDATGTATGPAPTQRASSADLRATSPWSSGTAADVRLNAVRGLLVAMRGTDLDLARQYARQALRSSQLLGDWAVVPTARLLMLLDELPRALDLLDRGLVEIQRRKDVWVEYQAHATRSAVLLEMGQVSEAMRTATEALRVAAHCSWRPDTALPRLVLASGLLLRGNVIQAERLVDGLDPDRIRTSVWAYPGYLRAHARLHQTRGDATAALDTLVSCGDVLDEAGVGNDVLAPWWLDAIYLLVGLGRAGEAGDLADRGTQLARRWPTARTQGMGLLASASVTTGPEQLGLAIAAADALTDIHAPCCEIRARLQLGQAMMNAGDRGGARKQLREVSVLCARQGFTDLYHRTERLLVSAGGRTPPSGSRLADLLTGSELRVAELAARGDTNREIAESLFVSTRTVEFHLTNVYRKAGSGNRQKLSFMLGLTDEIGELTG
ncbi:MAG: AAA family ATPase [Actinocatenispora sp.]